MKETEIDESEKCSVELNKSVHYTEINFSGDLEGKGGRREGEEREKGGRREGEGREKGGRREGEEREKGGRREVGNGRSVIYHLKCFTFCGNWCGVSHVIVCPSIST